MRWSRRTPTNKSYSPWGPFCKGVGSSLLNVYPVLAIYQVLATLALIMGFIRQYRSIFHDRWNLYHHDLHSPEPVVVLVHVGRDDSTWDLSLALGIAVICQVQIWIHTKLRCSRYRHVIIDRFSAKRLQQIV